MAGPRGAGVLEYGMTSSHEAIPLSPAQRRALKACAHALHPVVTIGDKGLSPAVLREIDVNLKSHDLIKVKAAAEDREVREDFLSKICTALGAQPVQHIGKILVVFRPQPEVVDRTADGAAVKSADRRSGARARRAAPVKPVSRAAAPHARRPARKAALKPRAARPAR